MVIWILTLTIISFSWVFLDFTAISTPFQPIHVLYTTQEHPIRVILQNFIDAN